MFRATNIPDPVKTSYLSVVRVTGNQGKRGSGTYLGDGLVLTNRHVVSGQSSFYITLKDGRHANATLQRISGGADLAILQTQNLDQILKPVPLAMNDVRPGQTVYPSGFDNGRLEWHTIWPSRVYNWYGGGSWESVGGPMRSGTISGNSGGPVFNDRGELIAPLWGTGGDPSTGNGTTMAVCYRSTRWFLLPWRRRIMRALESRWDRRPIVINIGNGQQFQPPTPQQLRQPLQPQGYKFEGKMIPLTAKKTDVKIVPLKYDDRGWKSSETQCEPMYGNSGGQIMWSQGGGYQQCPPQNYGGQYMDPYGGGGGANRPILDQGGQIPQYQDQTPEPQELELDYDALADALLPKLLEDDRFRGPAGQNGMDGADGRDGKSVTPQELSALGNVLLEQMRADPRFKGPKGDQGEITDEQVSELTEAIRRGLTRTVILRDKTTKEEYDREEYGLDEPFVFEFESKTRKVNAAKSR